jgi:hypothetical protein
VSDFLVCSNVPTLAGAVPAKCALCAADVTIAPSGQRMLRDKELTILCIPCAQQTIAADPRPEIAPVTFEQTRELLEHAFQRRRN